MLDGGAIDIQPLTVNRNNKKPFEFSKASDLTINITADNWLVYKYLEADTLALMFGDPGCGKSFVAFDIAGSVSSGIDWHGKAVKQGAVFYIAGEGHNGLGKRLKAWQINAKETLDDAPLYFSKQAASFYDKASAESVCDAVTELSNSTGHEPVLIIIDTLARNFGAANENSTEDVNQFISHIDQYLRDPFKACVLIVHHTGHGEKSRARGSMALKGALDSEYKVSQSVDKLIDIVCTKMKDSEEPKPLTFRLNSIDIGIIDNEGKQITSAALTPAQWEPSKEKKAKARLTGRNQSILNALHRSIDNDGLTPSLNIKKRFGGFEKHSSRKVVHIDDWRKEAYPVIDVDSDGEQTEAKKKAFQRSRDALLKRHIQTMDDFWWVIYE